MSGFTVIVPAFGAVRTLERCLLSVIANSGPAHTVLLADDASPADPFDGLIVKLRGALGERFQSVRRDVNLGFVGNVNLAMADTWGDVVLLNSDTVVTPGWLERLEEAFASDPRIATATPWSNNAEICSIPDFCRSNVLPSDAATWAEAALQAGPPCYPDLPTGVGFCMGIRRAAWDEVGDFDQATFGRGYGEENDFVYALPGLGGATSCATRRCCTRGRCDLGGERLVPGGENFSRLLGRYPDYNRRLPSSSCTISWEPGKSHVGRFPI